MAVFTIEFGTLIDDGLDVGLKAYPIFDEAYRERLNTLIYNRYRFREIGVTPPARFAFFFRRKMLEIMPYYNKFYESAALEFNPLFTSDITTTGTTTGKATGTGERVSANEGTSKATSDNTDKSRSAFSTMPQTQLAGNEDYASTMTDTQSASGNVTFQDANNKTTDTSKSEDQTMSEYLTRTAGYSGVNPGEQLERYRASLINTDLLVLDELRELFMQLWSANVNGF